MRTAEDVFKTIFSAMPSDEREKLYALIRKSLYPNSEVPFVVIIHEPRDVRFAEGITCPHCRVHVINGMVKFVVGNAISVKIAVNHLEIPVSVY